MKSQPLCLLLCPVFFSDNQESEVPWETEMGRFFLKRKQRTKTQPVLYINNNESLIFMATLNLIVLFLFALYVCVYTPLSLGVL